MNYRCPQCSYAATTSTGRTCPRCRHRGDWIQPGERALYAARVNATLHWLRELQAARATVGIDPPALFGHEAIAWLILTAINRRAGETEDRHARVSGQLNHRGRLCRFQTGDARRHLQQIAAEVNTPRLRVPASRLGEWSRYLRRHLPNRFTLPGDE